MTDIAIGYETTTGSYPSFDHPTWVQIVRLNSDGSVKASHAISGPVDTTWGDALAGVGDVNLDGTPDVAIGYPTKDDKGLVAIRHLSPLGVPQGTLLLGAALSPVGQSLAPGDGFGHAVSRVGDLDANGVPDVAVGAPFRSNGSWQSTGAIWTFLLGTGGGVVSSTLTDQASLGVDVPDDFGYSLASLGDMDGDGLTDLLMGTPTSGDPPGVLMQLFMNPDGSVRSWLSYDSADLGIDAQLEYLGRFGSSVATLQDLDGDGVREIAVGAPHEDNQGNVEGEVWILFPNDVHPATLNPFHGCGTNPPTSLTSTDLAHLGQDFDVVVDNPFDSQPVGTDVYLLVSPFPAAGGIFGCGVQIPGWHMDPAQPSAELLLAPPYFLADVGLSGSNWLGEPTGMSVVIPNEPALLGWVFYMQAVFHHPITAVQPFTLSTGLSFKVGT